MGERGSMEEVLGALAPVQSRNLSEGVLESCRRAIVRGHFEAGQRLSESRLAAVFGVSRGPVREALAQLEQEGLVRLEPRRGARVIRLSRQDIEELYELRIDLERLAAKRASRLISGEELEEMASVVRRYGEAVGEHRVPESVELDMSFHDMIYRAARHDRLYGCWSQLLRSQIHAFVFSRSIADPTYNLPCVSEHSAIHEALRARDGDRATELVEEHQLSAFERLMEAPLVRESGGEERA